MTPDREKIAARIRALRAKTVANGCTEAEALAAAELLAKLLDHYNMTLDEAELREEPFDLHNEAHVDWVGEKLWVVAAGISYLTGARYWKSSAGVFPYEVTFFGFAHEVEVARYMLEICAYAMRAEQARICAGKRMVSEARRRRAVRPFIDGMADRLRDRIVAMKPPAPTGKGLIVLHDQLVEQAMKDAGHETMDCRGKVDMDAFDGYQDGVRAADKVSLNPGLADSGQAVAARLGARAA